MADKSVTFLHDSMINQYGVGIGSLASNGAGVNIGFGATDDTGLHFDE
ncbi:hypothetical protein BNJ_00245 [Kaumoebavirus]|nr:hypothetical protein BNJ_00245 [Kaumoebavirus]ARA72073.1 hypothetical protein BNJ_00245 [Kaumoebavirus]